MNIRTMTAERAAGYVEGKYKMQLLLVATALLTSGDTQIEICDYSKVSGGVVDWTVRVCVGPHAIPVDRFNVKG